MLYLERIPAPPLVGFVRVLWYTQAPAVEHRRERVLPTGCVQVILNLARDFLVDCPEGKRDCRVPPALVVGARSVFEIIDTSDFDDLIGIVFAPGGFAPFAGDAVDQLTNCTVSLEDLWGAPVWALRDRLREIPSPPGGKLQCLEDFLDGPILGTPRAKRWVSRCAAVEYAVRRIQRAPGIATVRDVARSTGWSERRFSQVFREEVGLSPKVWCRDPAVPTSGADAA